MREFPMYGLYQSLLGLSCLVAVSALAAASAAQPAPPRETPVPAQPSEPAPPGNEPGGNEPGSDEPGTDEPGGDEPGSDQPGAEEPEAPPAESAAPDQGSAPTTPDAPADAAPSPPAEPGDAGRAAPGAPDAAGSQAESVPPEVAPAAAPRADAAAPKGPPPPAEAPASPGGAWAGPPASPQDRGVSKQDSEGKQKVKQSRWRLSRLLFDQSLTAQTLGVGEDYQSHNPTYDWTLQALPRYYFIDEERWSYNVQANLSIAQELTNSDETTQRSEVDFNDTVLLLRYDRTLYEKDGYETLLGFSFPEVTLPTSRASRNNGRILGLGVSVIPIQVLPLQSGPWLSSLVLAPIAGYHHYFTEATVPTNDDVGRVRTDVDGKSVVSDQLSDSAYAKHETRFGVGAQLSIHERVLLATDFQWRPTWNYQFDDDVEVCNLLTGCAEVDGVDNPEAYELVTVFLSELAVQVIDELSLTAGYVNLANATGPDGQHRSMFYSPNARIYLTATAFLSEIFDKQADEKFRVTRTKTAAAPKRAVVY